MTKNVRFIIMVFLCFFVSTSAYAQVAIDATTGLRNKYVLNYIGKTSYDKPVIQGDIWATLPEGFWLDVWYSTNLKFEENFGREVDYGVGWANKHVMVGFYYFDLAQQFSTKSIGDVAETFVKAMWSKELGRHRLSSFVEMNYFYATQDQYTKNGSFPMAGIGHDWRIVGLLRASHDAALTYDGGVFGSDHGFVFRYQASLSFAAAKDIRLRLPYFRIHAPLSSGIHDRKAEPVVGADVILHWDIVPPSKP